MLETTKISHLVYGQGFTPKEVKTVPRAMTGRSLLAFSREIMPERTYLPRDTRFAQEVARAVDTDAVNLIAGLVPKFSDSWKWEKDITTKDIIDLLLSGQFTAVPKDGIKDEFEFPVVWTSAGQNPKSFFAVTESFLRQLPTQGVMVQQVLLGHTMEYTNPALNTMVDSFFNQVPGRFISHIFHKDVLGVESRIDEAAIAFGVPYSDNSGFWCRNGENGPLHFLRVDGQYMHFPTARMQLRPYQEHPADRVLVIENTGENRGKFVSPLFLSVIETPAHKDGDAR